MCSGRVDLAFVLRAFSKGSDGVLIGGCHFNECHYITDGNYGALGMALLCKKIMEHIGLNPERLRLELLSAGEGIRFAEVMNEFGDTVKKLGPIGRGEGLDEKGLKLKLEAVTRLVPYIKLVERERLRVPVKSEEAYHAFFAGDEFKQLFGELIADPWAASEMMLLLRERPLSTKEIARLSGLNPSEVSRHLGSSVSRGFVRYDEDRKRFAIA